MKSILPIFNVKFIITVFLTILVSACGIITGSQDYHPVEFTAKPETHGENKFPNWPVPPHILETVIREGISSGEKSGKIIPQPAHTTEHGVSGPKKVTIFFPALAREVSFKWKVSPNDFDNFNNSIAREIATYNIQKLFLDPENYVVPATIAFCIEKAGHARIIDPDIKPQIKGSNCVFGNASVWLKDVHIPDVLYNESRFLSEPNYAHYLSNFNILTYLVEHRDARSANVLVSNDEKRRQVFMIDNSSNFGTIPYNYFAKNWNIIRVAALRKASIDRLRKVKRADLDYLGVVGQLEKDYGDGIYYNKPLGTNLDPEQPVRIRAAMIQFGLTKAQIDDVWERLQELLEEVDSGKIPLF
jgi:hypothetical protein